MTDTVALRPKITNVGLAALFNATNNGLEGYVSHVAFGDGAGVSYLPSGNETQLRRELARASVGGGERETPTQILIQGVLETAAEFWVREVGFFMSDGTLLALWSDPGKLLLYKSEGVPFIFAYGLALSGVPENSVNVQISGPAVNVVFDREFALVIANQARITRQQFHFNEAFYAEHGHYVGEQP